jgi:hypothetical protein
MEAKTMTTDTLTTKATTNERGESGPQAVARDVAETMLGAAGDAVARIPDAAATTRQTLADANRTLQAGSTESLTAGALLSAGSALGLFLGGANRFLVLLALIPAAAMALVVFDRQSALGTRRRGTA